MVHLFNGILIQLHTYSMAHLSSCTLIQCYIKSMVTKLFYSHPDNLQPALGESPAVFLQQVPPLQQ